jgi:hypothetical protein
MVAIAFQANPDKWTGNHTMRDYLENEDRYIYWSTPEPGPRRAVRKGHPALIIRTASSGRFGPRAIIAVGTVEELPKEYLPGRENQFAKPRRLRSPGDEHAASSEWKTGIRLSEVRWDRGILAAQLNDIDPRLAKGVRGETAFLLGDTQWLRIEALWANGAQA